MKETTIRINYNAPWCFDGNEVRDCNGNYIAYAEIKNRRDGVDEIANAKLIAASPTMYETLVKQSEELNTLINQTPTGELRNKLCNINIQLLYAIQKVTA